MNEGKLTQSLLGSYHIDVILGFSAQVVCTADTRDHTLLNRPTHTPWVLIIANDLSHPFLRLGAFLREALEKLVSGSLALLMYSWEVVCQAQLR